MKRFSTRTALFCSTLCLIAMIGMTSSAMAQFFGSDDEPVAPPSLSFSTKNKQLQDVLQLQYQIQVLKKLIEHEKAVNDIVKSSVTLGIQNPNIPTPDEKTCREIPANIPCAQAYHDLYDGFSVTAAKAEPLTPINTLPPAASILDSSDIPFLDAATLPDLPAELFSGNTLYWTDITCLTENCSAVITPDPNNRLARYRVMAGEKLPDGSIIQSISASGVRLEQGKKTIHLEPAPSK